MQDAQEPTRREIMTFVPKGNRSVEIPETELPLAPKDRLAPPYADAQYYFDPDFGHGIHESSPGLVPGPSAARGKHLDQTHDGTGGLANDRPGGWRNDLLDL